jgi:hypothetical protein
MKKIKVVASENYNYIFNRENGFFARWGKTKEDDPEFSPFGPEILDIEISEVCNMGCTFCFPSGTKISTEDGQCNIEDIEIEDSVIGSSQFQNKNKQKVKQLFERDYKGKLIQITLEDKTLLELTPNHLVYIKNKGWKRADQIQESDEVIRF